MMDVTSEIKLQETGFCLVYSLLLSHLLTRMKLLPSVGTHMTRKCGRPRASSPEELNPANNLRSDPPPR